MRMEFYVKTIPYDKNDVIYGVVSCVNNKPFDYLLGMHCGDKITVIDKITQMILKKINLN